MAEPLLEFRDVRAGYGEAVVLDGVSLALPANGSLAVLGRNGAGKTTLLLTAMGFVHLGRGSIHMAGRDVSRLPRFRVNSIRAYDMFPQTAHVEVVCELVPEET